jgi:hypothetical protein
MRWATSGREMVKPWRALRSIAVRYVPVSGPLVSRGGRIAVQSRLPSLSRGLHCGEVGVAAAKRLPGSEG